jgi:penicillin-binding protein 1A
MVSASQQKKNPGNNRSASKRGPGNWNHIHIIFFLLLISCGLTAFIAVTLYAFISLDIPDLSSLSSYKPPVTTFIYDDRNQVIDKIYKEDRELVNLSQTPESLPKAFVAAEDARFFQHAGVDIWSILRALVHNLKVGGKGQGGSTITQQVARSLLLSPEKTYLRKIKEAILAYRIDKVLSKNDILYIYLNQIYLGEGSYGVGAAARNYFGKTVSDLNLAEMSILAGLPQAPSRYSPFKNLNLAKKRQMYVLNRMAEDGYISAETARKAYSQTITLRHTQLQEEYGQYFIQQVKNYLRTKYGSQTLATGGLRVYTSLDPILQKAAESAINKGLCDWANRQGKTLDASPQSALVAINNQNGKVLALVGGKDFKISQYNRAIQAKRQPGSAFKPIIYAAALDLGFTPNELINDEETRFKGGANGKIWTPRNFSGKFYGPTTLRNGLVYSRNIVTIKLLQEVGVRKVIEMAADMGIRSHLKKNLALALGSSELSLMELTSAYSVFATGGKYHQAAFIDKVVDLNGKTIEHFTSNTKPVLDERVAFQVTFLLQDVINEGTGKKAKGLKAAAGKTGTTDRNMDAWFIGYTPQVTAGVWVGNDMHMSLGPNETGGRTAAPVWLSFMREVDKKMPPEEFHAPDGITFIPINRETGDFEYLNTDNALWEAFRKDNLRSWKNRMRR